MPTETRTRRARSPHAGVKLRKRTWASGEVTWFGRYVDPDDGKERDENLTRLGYTTAAARRSWAVTKSRALSDRTRELEGGATRHTGKTLAKVVDWYFAHPGARLRPSTRALYERDSESFVSWAKERGVESADELRQEHLVRWREWLASRPKRRARQGGRRGEREADARDLRSPASVNSALRAVKAILNELRRAGLVPHLSSDGIKDGLRLLRTPRPLPDYLRPSEAQALLAACLRHDAETFDITREENASALGRARRLAMLRRAAGNDVPLPRGSTPRYDAAAPFVGFTLLSGCRSGEAEALRWDQVDLEALDELGQRAGEVRLGVEVKTGRARIVDLAAAPTLRQLLSAMKLRAGNVTERPSVFGGKEPLGKGWVKATCARLIGSYGAPPFSPQKLRRTCATALVNSSIFGAATVWRASKQLGHSPQVLERHYAGLMRGVPREARTLEAVLGVDELMSEMIVRLTGGARRQAAAK
ncbi:MAG: hypothetical protein M9894_32570 [Planctomycetes bacterium]|nr:hypothetical protein [Planctomycetota bacterium]